MFNQYSKGSTFKHVPDSQSRLNESSSLHVSQHAKVGLSTSLGNTQVTVPDLASHVVKPHQKTRKERYELRADLQKLTDSKRFRACGRTPVNCGGVVLRMTSTKDGARAGLAGLSTCGSVWLCPVCSAKVAAQRADEVTSVIKGGIKAGFSAYMLTLTLRHDKAHTLEQVQKAVSSGWRAITSGRTGQSLKAHYGLKGWLKAVEITWSPINGWHVHLHVLVFLEPNNGSVESLKLTIWKAWKRGIGKHDMNARANTGGLDFQPVLEDSEALGYYLTKQARSAAQEAVMGSTKLAQGNNLTPFQLGAYAAKTGDLEVLEAWQEYAQYTHGKKQLTWSKGLREIVDLDPEQSDEEIAAKELGSSADGVLLLPSGTWGRVCHQVPNVLSMLENEGVKSVISWLQSKGLSYAPPPGADH